MDTQETLAPTGEEIEQVETAEEIEESAPSEPDAGEDTEEPKQPKGVQKRINELTRARYEAEQARNEAERRAYEMAMMIANGAVKPAAHPSAPQSQAEPSLGDFESFDAYAAALVDHRVKAALQQQQQAVRQSQEAETAKQAKDAFVLRMQTFAAQEAPDFERVAFSNPHMTDAMAQAIMASEDGPRIAYMLGKNPAESARLAALPPILQAREIGKIEANLNRTATQKTSGAPPPVKPVGSASGGNVDPSKMSTEEWIKWRTSQVRGKRR